MQHFSAGTFRQAPKFSLWILNVELLVWAAACIGVYIRSNYSDVIIIPKPGIAKLNNLLLFQTCSKEELVLE